MEKTGNQQTAKDGQSSHHPLKKSLALATMAASLGVALGVNVADVLAAEGPGSPPPSALSRQDKDLVSKQIKDANQIQQSMPQTNIQSKQIKIDSQAPQIILGK